MSVTLVMLSNSAAQEFYSPARGAAARALMSTVAMLARALPLHCTLCGAASGDAQLCEDCVRALPALGDACPSCALPVLGGTCCGACVARPPPQARAVAALAYAFPADRLVARLKYAHDLSLADALGRVLATAVRARGSASSPPDAIVPLPLSAARQRARGFNQACEIARPLSRELQLPLLHALSRDRDSPAQASLPRAKRAANVKGAFRATGSLHGLRIALVDDVMTTGATIGAAARACLAAGAREVDAWVVARTLRPVNG